MASKIPKPVIYFIVAMVVIVIIVAIVLSLKNKKSAIVFPNLPEGWTQEQGLLLRDKLYEYLKNNKVNVCTDNSDLEGLSTCAVPMLAKFLNPTQIDECMSNPEQCQNNMDVNLEFNDLALFMVCTSEKAKTCSLNNIVPPSDNQPSKSASFKLFI